MGMWGYEIHYEFAELGKKERIRRKKKGKKTIHGGDPLSEISGDDLINVIE